jgi:hypothetical protein
MRSVADRAKGQQFAEILYALQALGEARANQSLAGGPSAGLPFVSEAQSEGAMSDERVTIILTDEILARLEPAPNQEGPALRYRFARGLLDRAADVVLLLPAPIGELRNMRVSVTVNLAQDRPWLPLLTYRLSNEAPKPDKTDPDAEARELLIEDVASAMHNLGAPLLQTRKVARENYQSGDDMDSLFKRAIRHFGR